MKLVKVAVHNFRCIDDSTPFTLPQVTCLVGKNESGKSTLLLAIERLNPADPTRADFDKLLDDPRKHLADYEELHQNSTQMWWSHFGCLKRQRSKQPRSDLALAC